jgi:hypothetical protein
LTGHPTFRRRRVDVIEALEAGGVFDVIEQRDGVFPVAGLFGARLTEYRQSRRRLEYRRCGNQCCAVKQTAARNGHEQYPVAV